MRFQTLADPNPMGKHQHEHRSNDHNDQHGKPPLSGVGGYQRLGSIVASCCCRLSGTVHWLRVTNSTQGLWTASPSKRPARRPHALLRGSPYLPTTSASCTLPCVRRTRGRAGEGASASLAASPHPNLPRKRGKEQWSRKCPTAAATPAEPGVSPLP